MDARLIAGRYRVLRELGRGGMGVVYEVEHVHTGEQLALKLLHATPNFDAEPRAASFEASLIARFQREARAAAKIRSDHVVRVTDAGTAPELGNAPYFVMELLTGMDLERLVAQRGALAEAHVVSILGQVSRALDRAHSLGIVHRDLKPENLFLHRRDDGTVIVKILDFGISRFAGEPGEPQGLFVTSDGTLLGTPFYMAPEQARGRVHETGPAADIWALGIIALRLLTGKAYWSANTLAELMVQILSEPMPAPSVRFPELGTHLDAWFFRSCDRDPAKRFGSAGEQVRELSRMLSLASTDEQLTQSLVRLMDEELSRSQPHPLPTPEPLHFAQPASQPLSELSRTATFRAESDAGPKRPSSAPGGSAAGSTPARERGQASTLPSSFSPGTPATWSAPPKHTRRPRALAIAGSAVALVVMVVAAVWVLNSRRGADEVPGSASVTPGGSLKSTAATELSSASATPRVEPVLNEMPASANPPVDSASIPPPARHSNSAVEPGPPKSGSSIALQAAGGAKGSAAPRASAAPAAGVRSQEPSTGKTSKRPEAPTSKVDPLAP